MSTRLVIGLWLAGFALAIAAPPACALDAQAFAKQVQKEQSKPEPPPAFN